MDFKQLNTFRTAAYTLSFSETAHLLGCVQSAVTGHVKALENHLDIRLFERSGRGVKLTSAGKHFLQYADRLLQLRDEAEQSMQKGNKICGELSIAGYETALTYRLPDILTRFTKNFCDVRLNIVSSQVEELKPKIQSGQIDIAFTLQKKCNSPNLEQLSLRNENILVISHPSHPLVKKQQVTAKDLVSETLLLTEPSCNYRKQFESALSEAKATYGARQEFVSIEGIKSCVKLGMGIAAISEISIEKELKRGELVALNWAGPDLSLDLYMIWNSHRWMSPAIKTFIEYNQQHFQWHT